MSDRDWQHAVLRDLGAAGAGLADPRPPGPVPLPAPVGAAAPATERVTGSGPSVWYPEGTVAGEDPAVETAPPVLGAPPPPGREATAVFGLPPKDSLRSEPTRPEAPAAEPPVPERHTPENPLPGQPASGWPAHEQPSHAQPHQQPAYEQPAHRQAAYEQPAYEQPAYGQPAYEQSPHGQAPHEQAVSERPVHEQAALGQPVHEQAAWERPAPEGTAQESVLPGKPVAGRHAAVPEQAVPQEQAGRHTPEPSLDSTVMDPPPFVGQPVAPHSGQPPASPWAPSAPAGETPVAPTIGGFPETVPEQPGPVPTQPPGEAAVAQHQPQTPQTPQTPQEMPGQWGGPAAPASVPSADRPAVSPDALVRRKAHGDSALRRVAQGVRKAVGASAAGDLREMTGMAQRLQSPVSSCRRIAVTSIRGGAGKTTVAALLASVIAEHRDDRVLAMDADSGLGSLPLRLGVQPEHSMHDLVSALPRSWEETAQYLAHTRQGLWVVSGSSRGRVTELDLETFQAAAAGMSRYFSAAVIDCGAGIVARLQRGVLAAAHAQVFVTPGTVDGALSARQTLSWFVGSGYEDLLSRTVVALVTHSPHADGDADLEQARQVLGDGGLPVVVVPYDRHLATGTAIALDRVSGAARTAVSWIAAEAFARSLTGGAL